MANKCFMLFSLYWKQGISMSANDAVAANSNRPLWQRITFRLVANEAEFDNLSEVECKALWEKAVNTMRPDPEELQLLMNDEAARNAYLLRFVRAYKTGMPPVSSLTEHRFPPSSEQ